MNPVAAEYVSIADAAQILGVSQDAVRREIDRGHIPTIRIGRLIRIRRTAITDLEETK